MEDEINENFLTYSDLIEKLPFNFKLALVENQDVIIIETEKDFK